MASAPPNKVSVDKLTGEFLQCSLCLDSYKQPKVLHCQHTFCFPCLETYVNNLGNPGLINCPLCREPTVIPGKNIQSLKNNFLVDSLLSFIQKEQSLQSIVKGRSEWRETSVAKICEVCEEDKPTELFCNDCNLWLCKTCAKAHKKLPSTMAHMTLSVDVVVNKARDRLTDAEKELNVLLVAIDSRYQEALLMQQQFSEQGEQTATNIEQTFTKLWEILEEKKLKFLQTLAEHISKAGYQLETKIEQIEKNKFQVEKALEFVKETKSSSDAWHITSMLENVQKLRESTKDMQLPSVAEKSKSEFLAVDNMLKDVSLSTAGSLSFPSADPRDAPLYPLDSLTSGTVLHHLNNKFFVTGIALTRSGNMFVASNCDSLVMLMKGEIVAKIEHLDCVRPWGLALAPSSEIVITDCETNDGYGSVNVLHINGAFKNQIAHGLSMPRGVAIDKHGRVFVCDETDRCVYVMTPSGRMVNILKRDADGNFIFEAPRFVAISEHGVVVVSDNARTVKIFDAHFKQSHCYQSPFPGSEFWDVLCGTDETIYVADWNHGIHAVSPDGKFLGFVGSSPFRLLKPTSLTLHPTEYSLIVGTADGEVICIK
ncbi:tripartite motif-containing protein 2-like [Gigantopelta aegis]|uniref:tripartite motif-containing protein 2-like n=1 Tax=Gigantopelta aegis TaxID=1735272 RepID=UPI001B88E01E|nr:tripartite motif-containing protein 2-like [Gigantopelta aegis]